MDPIKPTQHVSMPDVHHAGSTDCVSLGRLWTADSWVVSLTDYHGRVMDHMKPIQLAFVHSRRNHAGSTDCVSLGRLWTADSCVVSLTDCTLEVSWIP